MNCTRCLKHWVPTLLLSLLILILDQWSKHNIWTWFYEGGSSYDITPFIRIILVWNHGISFGLFPAGGWAQVYILSTLCAGLVLILLYWIQASPHPLQRLALGMILGGAVGNIIDRVRFGAVIDFIDVHFRTWHWYTFNIADCGIVVGGMAFLLVSSITFNPHTSTYRKEGKLDE